jgi:hypothetical protein
MWDQILRCGFDRSERNSAALWAAMPEELIFRSASGDKGW